MCPGGTLAPHKAAVSSVGALGQDPDPEANELCDRGTLANLCVPRATPAAGRLREAAPGLCAPGSEARLAARKPSL